MTQLGMNSTALGRKPKSHAKQLNRLFEILHRFGEEGWRAVEQRLVVVLYIIFSLPV